MREHLKAFLRFLRLNRNASAHTVRAYESDLTQFLAHVAAASAVKVSLLAPAALDRQAIRGFVAETHKQGQSRATSARKLAAVRTFLRYLRREAEMVQSTLYELTCRVGAHLRSGDALRDAAFEFLRPRFHPTYDA